METIKTTSLKSKQEVINDLKEILELVNDGKEGYQNAAEATENPELKALFLNYSGERIVYAAELEEHLSQHGHDAENDNGGAFGGLHRAWLTIKQVLSSKNDKASLSAIAAGERAAIEKYDECIADYAAHADHVRLLSDQKDGVRSALTEIELRIVQLKN